jgi:L-threonylcarbamoyladenylate synthase
VTGPRIVGRRHRGLVAAALAGGQVVAVPGSGGYRLAARPGSVSALLALSRAVDANLAPERQVMVGRVSDAMGVAADWSETTRQLTESVWPGPVTVVLAARVDASPEWAGAGAGKSVRLDMPRWHALRVICQQAGPLDAVTPRPDGSPLATAEEVRSRFASTGLALILNGGTCQGPGPTEVDCLVSPPVVRRVGELPEAYIDAVLLMAARRRKRFSFLTSRRPAPN